MIKENLKPVNFGLPADLITQLDEIAQLTHIRKAQLLRQGVQMVIERYKSTEGVFKHLNRKEEINEQTLDELGTAGADRNVSG